MWSHMLYIQLQTLQSVMDAKFSFALKYDQFVPNLVLKHYGITEAEEQGNSIIGLIVTRIAVHDL